MIDYSKINKTYHSLIKGIELLKNSKINTLIVLGKNGLGKSHYVDYAVKEFEIDYVLFKGTISESRFFKFIQDNHDKTIIMRDCGSMLRRLTFLDFLKSATDLIPERKISRINYAKHEGVDETITFTGKIIWEINDIPKKNIEDLRAVIDRGILVELNPSQKEIKEIMWSVCKNDLEKEVTKYLISKVKEIGLEYFNIRTQIKCFEIVESAMKNKLDWKTDLDLFIKTKYSKIKKALYRFTGDLPCKRMDFVKYLMQNWEIGYVTAQTRIKESLIIEEIYSNGLQKQSLISLNKGVYKKFPMEMYSKTKKID